MSSENREYRLSGVRKIREKYRDDAAIVVEKCQGEVEYSKLLIAQTESELERKEEQLEKLRSSFEKETSGGFSSVEAIRNKDHLKEVRKQRDSIQSFLKRNRQELLERKARLEAAQDLLTERIKELKVLEKHEENWRKSRKTVEKRREQRRIDEIGEIYRKKPD